MVSLVGRGLRPSNHSGRGCLCMKECVGSLRESVAWSLKEGLNLATWQLGNWRQMGLRQSCKSDPEKELEQRIPTGIETTCHWHVEGQSPRTPGHPFGK